MLIKIIALSVPTTQIKKNNTIKYLVEYFLKQLFLFAIILCNWL